MLRKSYFNMGILNTLKNLFKPEKPIEIETIKLEEIEDWTLKSKKDLEIIRGQFVTSIREIMVSFSKDFSEKIVELEAVDLDKFKIEERGRKIVEENYKNYLDHVRKLRDEVIGIKVNDPILAIDEINIVFVNFEKKSNLNFQKASILIGNELGAVRESMGKFSREIKKLIDNNKDYLKKNEVVVLIEKYLEEIKEHRSQIENINNNLKTIEEDIGVVNKDIDNIHIEIKNIKNSEAYLNNLKKIKELDLLKIKYEKLLYSLKERVDFKGLSNFFHINKRDMEILNKFKTNFKENFNQDSSKLISLLNESKLMNSEIQDIIKEIEDVKDEVDDVKIEGDETDELNSKINRENIKIEDYEMQMAKDNKKLIRIQENIVEVEKQMVEKLKEINVEVLV